MATETAGLDDSVTGAIGGAMHPDHARRIADIRNGVDTPAARAWKSLNKHYEDVGALDREDRIGFVRIVLEDDTIESTKDLSDKDVETLVAFQRKWRFIQSMRVSNGDIIVEAAVIDRFAAGDFHAFGDDGYYPGRAAKRLIDRTTRRNLMAKAKKLGETTSAKSADDILSVLKEASGVSIRNASQDIVGRLPIESSIPSAIPTLSLGVEAGGLARQSVIQAWGPPGCGKSTWALNEIVAQQRHGRQCVYVNMERAFNPRYAHQIGVDTDKLFLIEVRDMESLGELLRKLADSDAFIVVDSIAVVQSSRELDRDYTASSARVGGSAGLLTSIINAFRSAQTETTLVLINQVRKNLDAGPHGDPNRAFGSASLHHAFDLSMKFTKAQAPDALKAAGYQLLNIRFDKNRWADTKNEVLPVVYRPGFPFNYSFDIIAAAKRSMKFDDLGRGFVSNTILVNYELVDGQPSEKQNHYLLAIDHDPEARRAFDADEELLDDKYKTADKIVDGYYHLYQHKPTLQWVQRHPRWARWAEDKILDTLNTDFDRLMEKRQEFS